MKDLLLIMLAVLATSQCKPRRESALQDFSTAADHDIFSLKVTGYLDEKFYANAKDCYDESKYTNYVTYTDPTDGKSQVAFKYSRCWVFVIEQVKQEGEQQVTYGRRELPISNLKYEAENLYCLDRGKKRTDSACLKKFRPRAAAAAGYFFQMLLPKDDSIVALEPFKEIRTLRIPLIEKQRFLKTPFAQLEAELTQQWGTGNPNFKLPVLAMVSGLASHYMFGDDSRFNKPEWMQNAEKDIEEVLLRRVAETDGLVTETFTADAILGLERICYRRVSHSCLSFRCTEPEFQSNRGQHREEYNLCRANIGDVIGVFSMGLLLPIEAMTALGTMVTSKKMSQSEKAQFKKDMDELIRQQEEYLKDKNGRNYVAIKIEDYHEIERYMRELGIKRRN